MQSPQYSIGQAVFIRTDVPDYAEETIPFQNLDELVRLCSEPRPNLVLEKIVVFSVVNEAPVSVTLGFVSASTGHRPGGLEAVEPG
ncbi:MAG: hypothetical protein HY301_07410 [Verrucomicrobia bacterium]|nr:hypothetical protein [Verrucomicrobiota bacterium]